MHNLSFISTLFCLFNLINAAANRDNKKFIIFFCPCSFFLFRPFFYWMNKESLIYLWKNEMNCVFRKNKAMIIEEILLYYYDYC